MMPLTIPLPKKNQQKLSRLALRYGLSLPELTVKILEEVSDEIPGEFLDDYDNPEQLKASFNRALADYRAGRVSSKL